MCCVPSRCLRWLDAPLVVVAAFYIAQSKGYFLIKIKGYVFKSNFLRTTIMSNMSLIAYPVTYDLRQLPEEVDPICNSYITGSRYAPSRPVLINRRQTEGP